MDVIRLIWGTEHNLMQFLQAIVSVAYAFTGMDVPAKEACGNCCNWPKRL